MLTKRLLNVQQNNITLKYIKMYSSKRYRKTTDLDRFLINTYYFITGEWCVVTAQILAFLSLKNKSFWVKARTRIFFINHPTRAAAKLRRVG